MFDFDAGKLLIIGIVALIVIGPKDLPRVLRQVGQMVSRVRRMAGEFQGQFMEAMKEADLQDLRTEVAKLKDTARIDLDFDPARDLKSSLLTAVDGTGTPAAVSAASGSGAAGEGVAGDTALIEHPPVEHSVEPPVAALPRASKNFPIVEVPPSPAAAGIGPVAEAPASSAPGLSVPEATGPDAPASDPAGSGARRKIRIARRPSRFDASADRAAGPGRTRNILPARLESPDR